MNNELKSVQFNWRSLGAYLARLSDNEQYEFFQGFADEMNEYDTTHQRDTQLCYIREYDRNYKKPFTKKQKEVFDQLGGADDT
jgi:hypothetical protein